MDADLLSYFLPEGVLEWFVVKEIEKTERVFRITLEEKNSVPSIPEEYRGKNLISKGFKKIILDDFPLRGRKTELVFLRRVWQIEGTSELLKRDIALSAPGTKLEKEFASFLKELGGEGSY